MHWLVYLGVLFLLYSTGHYSWLVVVGFIGFIVCLTIWLSKSADNSQMSKKEEKQFHLNEEEEESSWEEEKRKEKQRIMDLENEAESLRFNNGDEAEINYIDEQLGRNSIETEYEDQKWNYHR
ncbi:hypothetical protein MZM54_04005 [[Brevibacterium] frigoritolerans]|nr:hypothetical protein [Peribacillus frigoritolerans]